VTVMQISTLPVSPPSSAAPASHFSMFTFFSLIRSASLLFDLVVQLETEEDLLEVVDANVRSTGRDVAALVGTASADATSPQRAVTSRQRGERSPEIHDPQTHPSTEDHQHTADGISPQPENDDSDHGESLVPAESSCSTPPSAGVILQQAINTPASNSARVADRRFSQQTRLEEVGWQSPLCVFVCVCVCVCVRVYVCIVCVCVCLMVDYVFVRILAGMCMCRGMYVPHFVATKPCFAIAQGDMVNISRQSQQLYTRAQQLTGQHEYVAMRVLAAGLEVSNRIARGLIKRLARDGVVASVGTAGKGMHPWDQMYAPVHV
jgi:hypothetical protein